MSCKALSALSALCLHACAPEFSGDPARVAEARVLAVRAEPPEARPGVSVQYQALVAGPDGPLTVQSLHFAYCVVPKSATDNDAVSARCLAEPGVALSLDGDNRASGAIPLAACELFGSEPPPGDLRPADPDATGGYYQPLAIDAFGTRWFAFERIECKPRDVVAAEARRFAASYRANENPTFTWSPETSALSEVCARCRVELRATRRPEDREAYVFIDPGDGHVKPRFEALRTFWFATSGELGRAQLELAEQDTNDAVANTWTAPAEPGVSHVWAVAQDSRGGTAYAALRVTVR